MKVLNFYDLISRKSFTSGNYEIVTKKGKKFAVAKAPSGIKVWRILGNA